MLTDSNNTYDILGIDRNADKKTIKKAYAQLVKHYHPEDHPEEWKRIHDAYEVAMQTASGRKQKPSATLETMEQSHDSIALMETPEQEEAPNTLIGTSEQKGAPNTPIGTLEPKVSTHIPQETQEDGEDIFGDVEELANKQREEAEKAEEEKLESAIHEMRQLVWENKFETKEWRRFFEQEDLLPIISRKKFLRELGDCFFLKQINIKLYEYLNEQLDIIADYIKAYSTDSIGSMDMASVEYARSKVKSAYRSQQSVQEERHTLIGKCVAVIAVIVIFVFAVIALEKDEQRKEQERNQWREMQEQMREHPDEVIEKQQEGMRDILQEMLGGDPEALEQTKQRLQQELEEGIITQEYYDLIMRQFGFDQTDSNQ